MSSDGTSTMTIEAGGAVISPGLNVISGASDSVTVTGAGSTWATGGFPLVIGLSGVGRLIVSDGGRVENTGSAIMALGDEANGTATVNGADSILTISERLSIGGDHREDKNGGSALVELQADGEMTVGEDIVLFPDGILRLEGGRLVTETIDFRGGAFEWTGGRLQIDRFEGDLTVPPGGTLAPPAPVPGEWPHATTEISGDYVQQTGAALEIQIAGSYYSDFNSVTVAEAAVLGGELQVTLIDGYLPDRSSVLGVLTANSLTGSFSNAAHGDRLTTTDGSGSFLVHYGPASIFGANEVVLFDFEEASATGNLPPELVQPIPAVVLERAGDAHIIDLSDYIHDPDVPGTAVRIQVRLGAEHKNIDIALHDAETPQTVANFLAYIDAGRYADNFFHRSVPGFVIQGGGFRFVGPSTFDNVPTFPPVQNEPGISNVRGTIAMAKLGGDPDSATSQWFINLSDNSANLDAQNGGFTVFGRVVGDGMNVADEITALPAYNATAMHPAWTDLPLKDYFGNLTRTNFVETTASVIPALTFTAGSADPAIVSVSVDDGVLTLVPGSGTSGETVVTVSATDLDGATRDFAINVRVMDTYVSWSNDWAFENPSLAEPDADADGNGWVNLLEFAFGGSPLLPAIPPFAPRLEPSGGIVFGHRKNASLHYTAWTSTDLRNWSAVWTSDDGFGHATISTHVRQDGYDLLTIRPDEPEPQSPARFWRVTVEAP